MLRVTASPVTFAASQTDAVAASTVANLTNFVSADTDLNPTSLSLLGSPPADLTVSQIVIRSEKNPDEVAHRLYKGPDVPINSVMDAFKRDALKNEELTALEFIADHGMEIVFTYSNGTTEFTTDVLWDVE